jgi:ketosteroid isomerase-like protein
MEMEQLPKAVQRFLDALRTADWDGMEQHLTPDAIHDGSMPDWRVRYAGPTRIVQAYREEWTGKGTWRLKGPNATRSGDIVVVEIEGTLEASDGPLLCRIANFFELRDGRIAEHRYYCCGEWNEETVRRIEDEAPKVEPQAELT